MTLSIVMADDGIAFDGRTKDERPLGGAETSFAELAEALVRRGHRVTAISRCTAPIEWKGVQWVPMTNGIPDSADLYIPSRSWRLIESCRAARLATFWLHNPGEYLLKWRYQWRLMRRKPTLVFLGPYHLSTYPRWGRGGPRVIIPYGVDRHFLHANERSAPKPRAVFLSNPTRSLDWLLEVWAERIFPKVAGAELHVFGGPAVYKAEGTPGGEKMRAVLERARALAGSGVVLRGAIGKTELAQELTQARVLLYRGDMGEVYCNAVAEPQAMGVPGVTEDITCMRERISNGETGFVTQGPERFGEAAVRLLNDDDLWRLQHRNCLKLHSSSSWDAAAAAFERLVPSDP